MGGCSSGGGSCQRACGEAAQNVQILSCYRDEEVDEEVIANCKLLRASAENSLEDIREALRAGAELETRTSKYVMLPVKSWGESQADPDMNMPTASSWQDGKSARFGLTPLMVAAKEGRAEAVRLLLSARAHPQTQDEDGMRPLHFAAEAGCVETCKALLKAGAVPVAEDDGGRDAYACLPHECVMAQRERDLWSALLRPLCDEGDAKDAKAPKASREDPGSKELKAEEGGQPREQELAPPEWATCKTPTMEAGFQDAGPLEAFMNDPFLAAARGQDGM